MSAPQPPATPEETLRAAFPGLERDESFRVSSPIDPAYNCIGYAAGDETHLWWPAVPGWYWPPEVRAEPTLEAFSAAFGTRGFAPCRTGALEPGLEKVALYADAKGV